MAAADGGDTELADLRARVGASGGPAGASKTLAAEWLTLPMLDAEELSAESEDTPALEVDGVLDMT